MSTLADAISELARAILPPSPLQVLVGDCREMLRTMPAQSVQCCVTSPPYFGLRDYGVAGQIGLEPTPDEYVAEMVGVFREVRRVLRDDGTLWLNLGDSYSAGGMGPGSGKQLTNVGANVPAKKAPPGYKPKDLLGIPWQVALALRADGWYLRSDIIWHKQNPMPEAVKDRPTSAHEHIFLLTKSDKYFYDYEAAKEPVQSDRAPSRKAKKSGAGHAALRPNGSSYDGIGEFRNARNVWTINTKPFRGAHFATFPPELPTRCILAGSSAHGQCPHCGTPWVRTLGDAVPTGGRGAGNGFARPERVSVGGRGDETPRVPKTRDTIGWAQGCACAGLSPVPQTVLDPFGGAGTTGLVALELGRRAVLVELNPEYADMAEKRIGA